jgi:hypothetical protein
VSGDRQEAGIHHVYRENAAPPPAEADAWPCLTASRYHVAVYQREESRTVPRRRRAKEGRGRGDRLPDLRGK